jgi:hypothetical protein
MFNAPTPSCITHLSGHPDAHKKIMKMRMTFLIAGDIMNKTREGGKV